MQRFVADRMLGKLAKWLRVFGYDVVYLRQAADKEIVERLGEGRIFLTRGRRAGPWQELGKVFVVHANEPKKQLREVVQGLRLAMIVYSTQSGGKKFAQRCRIIFTRPRAIFIVAVIAARSTGQEVIRKRCASNWRKYWQIQTVRMTDREYHATLYSLLG